MAREEKKSFRTNLKEMDNWIQFAGQHLSRLPKLRMKERWGVWLGNPTAIPFIASDFIFSIVFFPSREKSKKACEEEESLVPVRESRHARAPALPSQHTRYYILSTCCLLSINFKGTIITVFQTLPTWCYIGHQCSSWGRPRRILPKVKHN